MEQSNDDRPTELDRFEMVLLRRPERRPGFSPEETDRLQELHLNHLRAMTRDGYILVAGPFDEQKDQSLRGMCIYQTGSIDRARELASSDPAVMAGRLEVEVMYFYCPKGSL